MYKINLKLLEHPDPSSVDVKDRREFAFTIFWLEDQKIRRYKVEDRKGLREVDNISAWERAYQQYKNDVGVPMLNSREEEMFWLLNYAVGLECLGGVEKNPIKDEIYDVSSGYIKEEPGDVSEAARNYFEKYDTMDSNGSGLWIFKSDTDRECRSIVDSIQAIRNTASCSEHVKSPNPPSLSSSVDSLEPVCRKASKSRYIAPSKRAYRDRRTASSVIKRISIIPENDRTEKQNSSLSWALKTVNGHTSESKDLTPKRKVSLDAYNTDCKRPKVNNASIAKSTRFASEPLNGVLKGHLEVAVIDRNDDDGRISPENWKIVQSKLASIFLNIIKEHPGSAPICRDAGWHQGHVKLVSCADQRSVDLYQLAIAQMGEVWRGAQLEVVAKEYIPSRPRSRAWIPTEPPNADDVLRIIKLSNPQLPTHNWKIVKLEEPKGLKRSACIVINKESLAPLAKTNGIISYGFDAITLKVYKKDEEVLPLDISEQNNLDSVI